MHERKEVLSSPVFVLPTVPRRSSAGGGVPVPAGLVERLLRVEVVELTDLSSPEERVEVLEEVAGGRLPRLEEAEASAAEVALGLVERLEVREDLGFFAFERWVGLDLARVLAAMGVGAEAESVMERSEEDQMAK